MRVMGIHHVTLIADDLDRAAWFYGQVLGLEQIERPAFDVQGLFFRAGDGQEIHITLAARPLTQRTALFSASRWRGGYGEVHSPARRTTHRGPAGF